MRRYILALICVISLSLSFGFASDGTVYNFLSLPNSSAVSALGGANVSLQNKDVTMAVQNPALLGLADDRSISLSYFNYVSDVQYGSALYGQAIDSLSWWGVGFTYLNYGTFDAYSEYDVNEGSFSAGDACLSAIYARRLFRHFIAGLSLKPVYSYIDNYTSFGLAVDLGANYYLPDYDFSAGFTVRNFGVQITPYEDTRENLPCDVQLGVSKRLAHAPFRFSLTYDRLNHWNLDYVKDGSLYDATETGISSDYKRSVSWGNMLLRHFIVGVEFLPSKNFSLMAAYNHRRNEEFSMDNIGSGSGFSFGGNIKVYKFSLGVSYAIYGPSGNVLGISLSSSLNSFRKSDSAHTAGIDL